MWWGKQIKSHTLHSYLVSLFHPMPAACCSSYFLLLSLSVSVSLTMLDCSVKVLCDCAVQKGLPAKWRDFHTASAMGNKMYIFGGRSDEGGENFTNREIYCNSMHTYDSVTNTWTALPSPPGIKPVGRRSHSTCKGVFWGVGGARVCVCVVHVSECVCVCCARVCVCVCMCVCAYLNAFDVAQMFFLLVVFKLIRLQ